jgi:hypothetical protein
MLPSDRRNGVRHLAIRPEDLMHPADEARLHGRGASALDKQVRLDSGDGLQKAAELATGVVVTRNCQKDRLRSQGCEIAKRVASAAKNAGIPLDQKNRDRRFRRYPLDFSIDKMIEHGVADTEHPRAAELLHDAIGFRGKSHSSLIAKIRLFDFIL